MNCPNCNGKRQVLTKVIGVYMCQKCRAIHGQCYRGDSYTFVLPSWHDGDADPADTFYYDLTVLGSNGVERRHGWAHNQTKKIVQVG